jgi:hypothetical protein
MIALANKAMFIALLLEAEAGSQERKERTERKERKERKVRKEDYRARLCCY